MMELWKILNQDGGEKFLKEEDYYDFFQWARNTWHNSIKWRSKINHVGGFRWSGKTTFMKILGLQMVSDLKREGKKYVIMEFNPRYLETQKIDDVFFNLLKDKLLQIRRSDNLWDVTDEILKVISGADSILIQMFQNISSFFIKKPNITIDQKISQYLEILEKEYRDVKILIIVDEIERLGKEKILEIADLLDIIQKISTWSKNYQVYSFFVWNREILSELLLSDNFSIDRFLSEKFPFHSMDVGWYTQEKIGDQIYTFFENIRTYSGEKMTFDELGYFVWVLTDLQKYKINIWPRKLKPILNQIERVVLNYKKNFDEIEIKDIFSFQILADFLYFLYIHQEKPLKYPTILFDDFRLNGNGVADLEKIFKEEIWKDHSHIQQFFENDDKSAWSFKSWFALIDDLIQHPYNPWQSSVFKNRERDLFYQLLAKEILSWEHQWAEGITKKYKGDIFNGECKGSFSENKSWISLIEKNLSKGWDRTNEQIGNVFKYFYFIIENLYELCIHESFEQTKNNIFGLIEEIVHFIHYNLRDNNKEFLFFTFSQLQKTIDQKDNFSKLQIYCYLYLCWFPQSERRYNNFKLLMQDQYVSFVDNINSIVDESVNKYKELDVAVEEYWKTWRKQTRDIDNIDSMKFIDLLLYVLFWATWIRDKSKLHTFFSTTIARKTQCQIMYAHITQSPYDVEKYYVKQGGYFSQEDVLNFMKKVNVDSIDFPLFVVRNSWWIMDYVEVNKKEMKNILKDILN